MSRLPITRPVRVASDLTATLFEDVDLNLFTLHVTLHEGNIGLVQGRTFRGCRLLGPAILLLSAGNRFDDCNFGDPDGDMRNLILRPSGPRALGTIPMRDCLFEGCEFHNIGFTGPNEVLDQLLAVGPAKS